MAKEFRDRFNRPRLGKSVHAFVDDKACIQCLPWTKKAGHCKLSGNSTHIGIEMCEPKDWTTDKEYFAKAYANMVDVVIQLCKQFGLTEKNILSHAEGYKEGIASNHADVGHWFPYFGKTMDDFRADVKAALNTEDISLKKGDKGGNVKTWQEALLKVGISLPKFGADADFGGETETATNAFKAQKGLPQNGIVDADTAAAMWAALSKIGEAQVTALKNKITAAMA
jgi:N-acetyl-anhydromuramyl-L-alanine amidase AmpD